MKDMKDGRNPAPLVIYETLWKMVQDFSHQQYERCKNAMSKTILFIGGGPATLRISLFNLGLSVLGCPAGT